MNDSREKFNSATLRRLMAYMKEYRGTLVIVVVCIVFSAIASAASSLFLQTLIDNYITPLLNETNPLFTGLIRILSIMAVIYLVGALSGWIYNKLMVTIAQGTLKKIRDEMFAKMQRLPVRYFDSHTHGEIMSLYTNDTDTLRQLIAQSMAQLISSICTIVAVFFCMLYLSIWLTLIVVVSLFLILQLVKRIAGRSAGWFVKQQKALGDLDGYVEEMVNGQKVIKVFCHEEQTKSEFRAKNKAWEESSGRANGGANRMMPMMNALGYVQYIILAIIGAYMAIAKSPNLALLGMNTLTLGTVVSFLTLSRSITNPISQISNQFNSIVTALAGASRIFAFMDESPEADDGYVTLVNVKEENGKIAEADEHTGLWAWKHPHGDGTLTYTRLQGRIVLDHVDFSYEPGKPVFTTSRFMPSRGRKLPLSVRQGREKRPSRTLSIAFMILMTEKSATTALI
jgi:ATP-binding cassette subfamily B protein